MSRSYFFKLLCWSTRSKCRAQEWPMKLPQTDTIMTKRASHRSLLFQPRARSAVNGQSIFHHLFTFRSIHFKVSNIFSTPNSDSIGTMYSLKSSTLLRICSYIVLQVIPGGATTMAGPIVIRVLVPGSIPVLQSPKCGGQRSMASRPRSDSNLRRMFSVAGGGMPRSGSRKGCCSA